jgi:hypothetical protein
MTTKISDYAPLAVGPSNSVWPASHIEFRDGRWVELVDDPVCIATFARDEIGTESARLLAAAPDLIQAGKHLAIKLAEVYRAAGQSPADCQAMRDWMKAIAKAEGR